MITASNINQNTLFNNLDFKPGCNKIRRKSEEGWAGFFSTTIYPCLDAKELEKKYCQNNGRSTMNLTTLLGLYIIQMFLDLTDQEALDVLSFDSRIHTALHIINVTDESAYCCRRTFLTFKKKLSETEDAQLLADKVLRSLISEFNVDTSCIRIDSMHIYSNMKHLRRAEIFSTSIKSFIKALKKNHRPEFDHIDPEATARYLKDESGYDYFSQVKPSETKRILKSMAEDLYNLLDMFKNNETVASMAAYSILKRIFNEQREIAPADSENAGDRIQLKEPKDVRSDSLQNPSDPDATYDGHKGKGYQVQICETCSPNRNPEDANPLSLITFSNTEQAHMHDSQALIPAAEALAEKGLNPKTFLADAAYGSDDNEQKLKEMGIQLFSPVSGKNIGTGNTNEDAAEAETETEAENAEAGSDSSERPLTLADFETDKNHMITVCPMGQKAVTRTTKSGSFRSNFDCSVCRACPRQSVCPVKVGKRSAAISYSSTTVRVAIRRVKQETKEFKDIYRRRSGIEATNSQLAVKFKMKRLRYRGLKKVKMTVLLKVVALNIWRAVRFKAQQSSE